jgi:hypothetical protein
MSEVQSVFQSYIHIGRSLHIPPRGFSAIDIQFLAWIPPNPAISTDALLCCRAAG